MKSFKRKLKYLNRIIVQLLVFTLIVSMIPITAFGDETSQTQSNASQKQKQKQTKQEVVSLRTATSKTYKNPDGTYTAEVMSEPVHYKVGNQWEDIDNTLLPSKDDQNYENQSNQFKVKFDKAISEQSKRLFTYEINNHSVDFDVYQNPKPMNQVFGATNKNEMKYPDAYPNVSYDYKVDSSKVKENIVLSSYPNTNTFKFFIKGDNLKAEKGADGKIYFYDKDSNQFEFFIQKPFMYDSEANKGNEPNLSEDVTQDIAQTDGGFILTVTADDNYLKDPKRVYPVTIDPWIDYFQTADTYIASSSTANFSNDTNLSLGYDASLGNTRTLMKWSSLPVIPPDSEIAGANIGVTEFAPSPDPITNKVYLYKLTQSFTPGTVTYANQPTYYSTPEDTEQTQPTGGYTYFNVGNLVKSWYANPSSNYGVELKYVLSDENNHVARKQYYSSEYTGGLYTKPKLVINYRPKGEYGDTDYWTYTPNLMSTDGQGKVNVGTGNFVYTTDLFSSLSRTNAFDLSLTYNSQSDYNNGVGYGWVLNAGRKLAITSDGQSIVYTDDTGTRYDFNKHQEDTSTTYSTPLGTYFTFTVQGSGSSTQYIITYPDETQYIFDSLGRIYEVVDENKNKIIYSYSNSTSFQLVKISERYDTDTTGKDLSLTYDTNGLLSKITDDSGTDTSLTYTNTGGVYHLSTISKGSNQSVPNVTTFNYDTTNSLSSITDANNHTYSISYGPNPDDSTIQVVTSVTDPQSKSIGLAYSAADPATEPNYYKGMIKTCDFTDENHVVTRYTNSVDGKYLVLNTTSITTDVNGTPSTSQYTWSGNRVTSVNDPNQKDGTPSTTSTVSNTYNSAGLLTKSADNTGVTSVNSYDSKNNVTNTSVNGFADKSIYDENSNLLSSVNPFTIANYNQNDKYGNTIGSTDGTIATYNRLKNSSFEYLDSNNFPLNWTKGSHGTYSNVTSDKVVGNHSMAITLSSTDGSGYLSSNKFNVDTDESDKGYVVSGYLKTANLTGKGAYLAAYFYDANNQLISSSKTQALTGTNDWTRVSSSFTAPSNTNSIQVYCYVEGTGTAYFDAIQLNYGQVVPNYVANENPSFEYTGGGTSIDNWTLNSLNTGDGYSTNDHYRGDASLKLTSNGSFNAYSGEYVEVSGKQGDPITVSGWSRTSGASATGGDYEVRLWLEYTDGTEGRFDFPFNKNILNWQFTKDTIRANKDFKEAKVYAVYYTQPGSAYFDNIKVEQGSSKSSSSYDSYGLKVNSSTDANNNTTNYTYDANGNQTSIVSPMAKKTSFVYDYLNRLTSTTLVNTSDTDPSNIQVKYAYDPVGNLLSRTNGLGFTTNYAYNEINQLTKETDPVGKYMAYSYDNNGNVTQIVKGTGSTTTSKVTMKYNAQNQLSERDGGDGSVLDTYAYDRANNLTSVTTPGGTYNYTYDAENRLTNAAYPDGYGVQYNYDNSGSITQGLLSSVTETQNGSSESTSYSYNSLQALTKVTRGSGSAQWSYDEKGKPVQIQLGSLNLFQGYDDNGQLTNQNYYLPTPVNFQYTYDKDGNIVKDGSQAYTYDFADRLQSWNNGSTTVTYQYDKAGNLLNPSGKSLSFNAANEINGYTYDGAGNLIQDDQYKYIWNDLGQLTSVQTLSGTPVASYTYYSNGLRQTKTVGSTTYTYYYDQNNNLIRVVDNTGKVLWRITWGNGKPMFLTNAAGTIYYYVTNYRGDVVQIVDASGNKVADYSYDPWGNVLSTNESAEVANQPLGYASYVYDREISQYYLQARYYKPADGVFLSRDPVDGDNNDPLTQNGYSYGNDNPVMNVDPDGATYNPILSFIPELIATGFLAYSVMFCIPKMVNEFSRLIDKAASEIEDNFKKKFTLSNKVKEHIKDDHVLPYAHGNGKSHFPSNWSLDFIYNETLIIANTRFLPLFQSPDYYGSSKYFKLAPIFHKGWLVIMLVAVNTKYMSISSSYPVWKCKA